MLINIRPIYGSSPVLDNFFFIFFFTNIYINFIFWSKNYIKSKKKRKSTLDLNPSYNNLYYTFCLSYLTRLHGLDGRVLACESENQCSNPDKKKN